MSNAILPEAFTEASTAALLRRPELRLVAEAGDLLSGPVRITPEAAQASLPLRYALELKWMRQAGLPPALSGLAAARTALLFNRLEQICRRGTAPAGRWMRQLAPDIPPDRTQAAAAWARLAADQPGADPYLPAGTEARLAAIWPLLGPAEWLMERGGDARLRVDPQTGLNGYGCSHRPRPWAITYASSTASSVSERGYAGAEAARKHWLIAALQSGNDPVAVLAMDARRVRQRIAECFAVPPDGDVILAASGTDCELFMVALAQLACPDAPVTNILLAPEETGSGVPLAASGRHFAMDTARGVAVTKGATLRGYRPDTILVAVPVRAGDGAMRSEAAIVADCRAAIAAAPGYCLLHLLDVSKTGVQAPSPDNLPALLACRPGAMTIVVDACQTRISTRQIRAYLDAGCVVLVTGSKFFTGPPFAGAILLPGMHKRGQAEPSPGRLLRPARNLPAGLHDYTARPEWPESEATASLPPGANPGLLMRWHAALAEIEAFQQVPDARCDQILRLFTQQVRAAILANPSLMLIDPPPLRRGTGWDTIATLLCFALRDTDTGALLDMAAARQVYAWLNADLSTALALDTADRHLARRFCHLGQPAPLPGLNGATIGVLRLSAGARLVSGEPAHAGLASEQRVFQEIEDARTVLGKIALIMRHRSALSAQDIRPSYIECFNE